MTKEELKQRLIDLMGDTQLGVNINVLTDDFWEQVFEDLADHLIANGVTIRDRGEWISVTERLPERFTQIIVCDKNGMVGEAYRFEGGRFVWLDDEEFAFATHWMPLPEPPERSDE